MSRPATTSYWARRCEVEWAVTEDGRGVASDGMQHGGGMRMARSGTGHGGGRVVRRGKVRWVDASFVEEVAEQETVLVEAKEISG
jgi:hypothetical protein